MEEIDSSSPKPYFLYYYFFLPKSGLVASDESKFVFYGKTRKIQTQNFPLLVWVSFFPFIV